MVFHHGRVKANRKSKYKPVIPIHERYRTLMAIRYIDEVYVYQTEEELRALIEFFKPDIRILGEDYIGKSFTGDDLNIPIYYHERNHDYSSSDLLLIDGVRVKTKIGWWLIRASNTQAALIVCAESDTNENLKQLLNKVRNYLKLVGVKEISNKI